MQKSKSLSSYFFIAGILFCLSVVFVIFPIKVWENVLRFFVGEHYEMSRFYEYIFRSSVFGYVIIGIFLLVIATDPQRYKPLIWITLVIFFANALICFLVGIHSGVTPLVYLFDTIIFLAFGVVLLYLGYLKKS